MEASSTTLNISSPAQITDETKIQEPPKVTISGNGAVMHSHGANFGRYVKDCPACIKRWPDGPPVRGATVKRAKNLPKLEKERIAKSVETVATQANAAVDGLLSEIEQLKRKLAAAQNKPFDIPADTQWPERRTEENPMAELVAIQLRREAREAAKEQAKFDRDAKNREDNLAMEQMKIAQIQATQAACSHTKENGRTAINGQVHNDGLYHPFCQRCFKTFTPVLPRGENIQNAVMG